MKLLTIFVLLIQCGILHAQRTNGVQFIINPLLQDFGNLEKRYTIQDCETIFSDHKKYPSFEGGALYHHNFNNKWGWGVGLTYRFAKYESDYKFTLYERPEDLAYEYYSMSKVHFTNLKLQASYQPHKRIKINAFLNVELPVKEIMEASPNYHISFGLTNHYVTPSGSYSEPVQYNDIHITNAGYDNFLNFIPEISVNYEILKGLNLSAGFRFKFWKENQPIIQAKVEGFTGPENYNNQKTIYLSQVDDRDYSLVIGLMYELKRTKK